ncbi:MAG TPA: hypothetical protein VM737_07335 [Gemmatimonadota bacterium]|nr:hypothetical protein [Gemmatimonadota bacterium]
MSGLVASLRDFFTQNLGYKLIALLLALLLWFDVTSDETTVIDYPVPLRIAVEGRDMIITNEVAEEVEVTFAGTGKELMRLDKEALTIRKTVQGGENDTTSLTVDPSDVERPADLNVTPLVVSPGQVTVVTDRFIEKTVALEPIGMPVADEGHQVLNVRVEPRRVQVRGVTAEVRPIGSLALDLSQLSREPGPFDEHLEIAVPESLRTVTVEPDSVRIRGTVVRVEEIDAQTD